MTRSNRSPSTRLRFRIIGVLGAASLLLILAIWIFAERPGGVSAPGTKVQPSGTVSEIGMDVDSVCRQFGIPARAVRMRTVKNAGGAVVRREYRIAVPVDFSSLEFNKEINTRVAEFGARVQGSERTRDRTVTLTVLKNDETLVTILLNLRQEPY